MTRKQAVCFVTIALMACLPTSCRRVDCGKPFNQVGNGPFTQASTSGTPCTPNPCVGQCAVAAHMDADAKAKAVCLARNPKCHVVLVGRDNKPAQACTQEPRVSFTCTCTVTDSYECDD
jgi:hypothetical protein